MQMEAIVLAGGLGTRLHSVVSDVPKCLAPISGNPFLWYLCRYLKRYDVHHVVFSVGYLKEQVCQWVNAHKQSLPFDVSFAEESVPLGTGGAIKNSLNHIKSEEAVVLNGDTFFDVPLDAFFRNHKKVESHISIALKRMKNFDRYGTVEINEFNSKILKFSEKKYCEDGLINGGVYLISKNFILNQNLPAKFSFETEILQKYCGKTGCIYGFSYEGYFIDIGIPADYERAQHELGNNIANVGEC